MKNFPEKFRPRFHFTPRKNWCNDPNGLVWWNGEFHLFYQYNPFGDVWGHMSWGHAVSRDLLHWTELAVAIAEDERNMIFSGSAVVDADNTVGFGANALVAIYTGHEPTEPQHQTQNLAYSLDDGRSWIKYADNPVLDIGLEHFRDPKVFWHQPSARWVMIVALSHQNKISLYQSPDLRNWRHLSDFGPAGAGGELWECPDLFTLPIKGREKWVLKVDMFEGGVAGGSSAQYFVGEFDGVRFTPDKADDGGDLWGWGDFGKDFYAAVTWSNVPPEDGRRLWIGWMCAHQYGKDLPTSPWRGGMSLPRELSLEPRARGLALIQQPVIELEQLRRAQRTFPAIAIENGEILVAPLADCRNGFEFKVEFDRLDADECGLVLKWSSGDEFRLGYDRARGALFADRSHAGLLSDDARFTGRRYAPLPNPGTLALQGWVDACSVELFADFGAVTITELMFPQGDIESIALFAQGGRVAMREMQLWALSPSVEVGSYSNNN